MVANAIGFWEADHRQSTADDHNDPSCRASAWGCLAPPTKVQQAESGLYLLAFIHPEQNVAGKRRFLRGHAVALEEQSLWPQ